MANKNTAGNTLYWASKRIDRLHDEIARRDGKGENMENVDHVYNNHSSVNDEGERTWTF